MLPKLRLAEENQHYNCVYPDGAQSVSIESIVLAPFGTVWCGKDKFRSELHYTHFVQKTCSGHRCQVSKYLYSSQQGTPSLHIRQLATLNTRRSTSTTA